MLKTSVINFLDSKRFSADLTCPVKTCRKYLHHSLLCFVRSCLSVMLPFKGQGHIWVFHRINLVKHYKNPPSRIVKKFQNMVKCKVHIFNSVSISIFYSSMQRFPILFLGCGGWKLKSGDQGWGEIRGGNI